MGNIKLAIQQLTSPKKEIGEILIEFYETMKSLENDKERGGKQATKIVMTLNDIENLFPYGQDYEDKQREADDIVNQFDEW